MTTSTGISVLHDAPLQGWRPIVLGVLLLTGFSIPMHTWSQSRPRSDFSDVSRVTLVEIPVQVTRDGRPVRGLTRDSFVVREGRKTHAIVGFDAVDLNVLPDRPEAEMTVAADPTQRSFLFLFDFSFSEPGNVLRARRAALSLLEGGMHPTDAAGVATYHEARGLDLVLNFTRDRAQIRAAIEGLGVGARSTRAVDPLKLYVNDVGSLLDNAMTQSGTATARGDDTDRTARVDAFLTSLLDQSVQGRRNSRAIVEGQVLQLGDALRSLSELVARVRGRTHIVLLSEGFDGSVLTGNSSYENQRMEQISRDIEEGQTWKVDSDERYGSTSTITAFSVALRELHRAGASIHPVDIAGVRAGSNRESAKNLEGLFLMAEQTGGTLVTNSNDLAEGMTDVLEQTSVTYVLAIQPEDLEPDGSFHPLEVRLADGERGARIEHRPGFFAPTATPAASADAQRVELSQLLLGDQVRHDLDVEVQTFPLRREGGVDLPVVFGLEGGQLLRVHSAPFTLDFFGYALGTDGSVVDFFAQNVQLDPSRVGDVLGVGGVRFATALRLPMAPVTLRVMVRDRVTGYYFLGSVPVVWSEADDGAWCAPPVVFEPGVERITALSLGDRASSFPFVWRDKTLVPSPRAVLDGPMALAVYGGGWRAEQAQPVVHAVNAHGDRRALPVLVRERLVSDASANPPVPERLFLQVDPEALPRGQWTLTVEIEDAGSCSSGLPASQVTGDR